MGSHIDTDKNRNIDDKTVQGFGYEWELFTQDSVTYAEKSSLFDEYFAIFPWHILPDSGGVGADIGCGSGRWAAFVAKRVSTLHLIDASSAALDVARRNLSGFANTHFHCASVSEMPIADGSLDFAYSLGVLHHVPNTRGAIKSIAAKLKRGAPFLLYIYYAFDNRPSWYRRLWALSNSARACIARLPGPMRYGISQFIAAAVYWPLARAARVMEGMRCLPASWPLAYYRDRSFYIMRNDALDRFGTRLEKRYTRVQITKMLKDAGFADIKFSERSPYWCAVGIRA
ncbi:class I SAM-dependent methyltransferase [Elusimicrobiota bacterium]